MTELAAVIFDLDGVLVDSEGTWSVVRREIALQNGGRWPADAQRSMMGMSSTEWSAFMQRELGVQLSAPEISELTVSRLEEHYREHLPLVEGAHEVVVALSEVWTLALASSSNRPLIDLVLQVSQLGQRFSATVSSEEVPRGKPTPDVYLEAARRINIDPARCAAVEDSSNGLRSASAAGMTVIAAPNREFPPVPEALALADDVVEQLVELTPERVRRAARTRSAPRRPSELI